MLFPVETIECSDRDFRITNSRHHLRRQFVFRDYRHISLAILSYYDRGRRRKGGERLKLAHNGPTGFVFIQRPADESGSPIR
jgi:hypothetical protein